MTDPIDPLPSDIDPDEYLDFDAWTDADDKVALRVIGDYMIDDHICDGDYVIIQRQSTARDGQTVALRLPDGEATLRVYRRDGSGNVRLESRNRGEAVVDEVYLGVDDLKIVGVLAGVVRRY